MKSVIISVVVFIFFFTPGAFVFAHPHVFMANKVETVFDDSGLAGFNITWDADEFSTASLTDGYDENENGKIDKNELDQFTNDCREHLKSTSYFTWLKINNTPVSTIEAGNFSVVITNNTLVYSFFIPCKVNAEKKNTTITFSQYDNSYFTWIGFAKEKPATLLNGEQFNISQKIAEDKTVSYYFGMVHPVALIINFSKK